MNKTILIIIVVLLAVVGGYFLLKGKSQTPPTTGAPETITPGTISSEVKEVNVSGSEFSFSPASITVKTGEKVKLTFRNQGGAPHNLVIEGLGVSTKTIGSGSTDVIEFTAPAAGDYPISCLIPGHKEAGMAGKLIVE